MFKGFHKDIVELGLTDKEATAYLALLSLGTADIEQLAKESSLNKSTAYVQIQSLIEMGLVSSQRKGKKVIFVAESPRNLERVLENRIKFLKQKKTLSGPIISDLLENYVDNGSRPSIRLFEGKEGLISMREEILECESKEVRVISAYANMKNIFSERELNSYSEKRAEAGIKSYVLYTYDGPELKAVPPQEMKRFNGKSYDFDADTYLYDDNVAFATAKGAIMGVIINSRSIYKSHRALFEILWKSAE